MQPDTINALGMILMVVFTTAIVLIFRSNPIKNIPWKKRIPLAIGGMVFALIFFIFAVRVKDCVEIPEPFGQFEITALCMFFLILFVDRKLILLTSCFLILYAGVQLRIHFIELVHYSDEYYTIDANTHKLMAKGCSDMKSTEGVIVTDMWHTWFTGIYRIKK